MPHTSSSVKNTAEFEAKVKELERQKYVLSGSANDLDSYFFTSAKSEAIAAGKDTHVIWDYRSGLMVYLYVRGKIQAAIGDSILK